MTSPLLNVMTAAAIKAGKGLVRDFGEVGHLQVSRKGPANFVTASDTRTEKLLHKELKQARPDYGFLMEESGEIAGKDAQHRWVIDPLDGTTNFIHAIPYFCISIGLEKRAADGKSEVIAGVIFDPIHNELFAAEKGKGALLNGQRMMVSRRDQLAESMVVAGSLRAASKGDHDGLPLYTAAARSGAIIRDFGACALDFAYVAAGRVDACHVHAIQPWDIAAGMLLIQEAGGLVTETDGAAATIYSTHLLASNRLLHPHMQQLLAKAA